MEKSKTRWFNDDAQNNFKADFGFMPPHRTKAKCTNPVFYDHHLHRIAIMKDYHVGSEGDINENGLKGWVSKFVCTGCGKRYRAEGLNGYFHPDKKELLQHH